MLLGKREREGTDTLTRGNKTTSKQGGFLREDELLDGRGWLVEVGGDGLGVVERDGR